MVDSQWRRQEQFIPGITPDKAGVNNDYVARNTDTHNVYARPSIRCSNRAINIVYRFKSQKIPTYTTSAIPGTMEILAQHMHLHRNDLFAQLHTLYKGTCVNITVSKILNRLVGKLMQ